MQQGWPRPPQGVAVVLLEVHEPPATVVTSHTGLVVLVISVSQAAPAAMHNWLPDDNVVLRRVTQQPPVQALPGQHGVAVEAVVPGVPHTVQRELLQMVFASLHVLLAQQGPPAAPHTWQMLVELSQAAVASLHPVGFAVEVAQQDSPKAPQVRQV